MTTVVATMSDKANPIRLTICPKHQRQRQQQRRQLLPLCLPQAIQSDLKSVQFRSLLLQDYNIERVFRQFKFFPSDPLLSVILNCQIFKILYCRGIILEKSPFFSAKMAMYLIT